MAQSYRYPGATCYGPSAHPDTPEGWFGYCDCMFEPRSEDWYRCLSLSCAIPGPGDNYGREKNPWGGCARTTGGLVAVNDPFNVNPFMLAPPWTDVGAGARGIPKPGASLAYELAQVLAVDPYDFTPLRLWQLYFKNKTVFILQAAKTGIISNVMSSFLLGPFGAVNATVFTQAAVAALTNPPLAITALGPPSLVQCAIEGKDVWKEMFKPALQGTLNDALLAMKVVGPAMGGQVFQAAGAIVARYAQDQFDTNEIARVQSKEARAVITFLAKYGETLGQRLQEAVNQGLSLQSAPAVIEFVRDVFGDMAKWPEMDLQAQKLFGLISRGCGVAALIARGVKDQTPALEVLDSVVFYLFGFSFAHLRETILGGKAAVQRLLAAGSKVSSFGEALDLLNSVVQTFGDLAKVVEEVNQAVGGVIDGFSKQFADAAVAFGAATQGQIAQTVHEAEVVASGGAPGPALQPAHPGVTAPAPKPKTPAASSSGLWAAVAAAAAGGAVAGPAGAGVGAVLSFALTSKPASAPPIQRANVAAATASAAQSEGFKTVLNTSVSVNANEARTVKMSNATKNMLALSGYFGEPVRGAMARARAPEPQALAPIAATPDTTSARMATRPARVIEPAPAPALAPMPALLAASGAAGRSEVPLIYAPEKRAAAVIEAGVVGPGKYTQGNVSTLPPVRSAGPSFRPALRVGPALTPDTSPTPAPEPVSAPAPIRPTAAQIAAALPRGSTGSSITSLPAVAYVPTAPPADTGSSASSSSSSLVDDTASSSGSGILALAAGGGLLLFFLARKRTKGKS